MNRSNTNKSIRNGKSYTASPDTNQQWGLSTFLSLAIILVALAALATITASLVIGKHNRADINSLKSQQGSSQNVSNANGLNDQNSQLESKVSSLEQKVNSQTNKGEKGDKGDKGDTGARGATGATGATGVTGATGATGPAGSGTTNASDISSGTLSDSRLSANVALLNGTGPQTFTGNNKFTGTILSKNASNSTSAFAVQDASGVNLFNLDTSNGNVTVSALSSSTYSDEFNTGGPTADAKWTFTKPSGDSSTYDVNSTVAGKLHITSSTSNHDCWPPSAQMNCLMLLETPPTGDFQAEVKIDTTPATDDNQAPGMTV